MSLMDEINLMHDEEDRQIEQREIILKKALRYMKEDIDGDFIETWISALNERECSVIAALLAKKDFKSVGEYLYEFFLNKKIYELED